MRIAAVVLLLPLAACLPFDNGPDAGIRGYESPCGICRADEYCDVAANPPVCKPRYVEPPQCSSRCKANEYCDTEVDPPTCKNVCTRKKSGCPMPTVCDVAQERCVNPTCNGVQCATGEGCYEVASLVTGDLIPDSHDAVCTCAPALISRATGEQVQDDTCAGAGQVCDIPDFSNPTQTACRLPRQFEYCVKSVGCEGGTGGQLECMPAPFSGDDGKNRCFAKCAKTADCPDPEMKCWPNNAQYPAALRLHCFYNYCAESTTGDTDPTQFYKRCPSMTNTDGQCLPFNLGDGTSLGLCRQTGTVASGRECQPDAQRPYAEYMCPAGEFCETVQPGASAGSVRGICRTLCNAAPAGPSRKPDLNCATGKVCTDENAMVPVYSDPSGGPLGDWPASDARLGFCRDQCDLLSSADTCGQDVLMNEEACYYNYGGHTDDVGACRPVVPDAPGSGADCLGPSEDERRAGCADRLFCAVNLDSRCHRLCDLTVCSNSDVACAQCDAGQKCIGDNEQDSTQAKLGLCL